MSEDRKPRRRPSPRQCYSVACALVTCVLVLSLTTLVIEFIQNPPLVCVGWVGALANSTAAEGPLVPVPSCQEATVDMGSPAQHQQQQPHFEAPRALRTGHYSDVDFNEPVDNVTAMRYLSAPVSPEQWSSRWPEVTDTKGSFDLRVKVAAYKMLHSVLTWAADGDAVCYMAALPYSIYGTRQLALQVAIEDTVAVYPYGPIRDAYNAQRTNLTQTMARHWWKANLAKQLCAKQPTFERLPYVFYVALLADLFGFHQVRTDYGWTVPQFLAGEGAAVGHVEDGGAAPPPNLPVLCSLGAIMHPEARESVVFALKFPPAVQERDAAEQFLPKEVLLHYNRAFAALTHGCARRLEAQEQLTPAEAGEAIEAFMTALRQYLTHQRQLHLVPVVTHVPYSQLRNIDPPHVPPLDNPGEAVEQLENQRKLLEAADGDGDGWVVGDGADAGEDVEEQLRELYHRTCASHADCFEDRPPLVDMGGMLDNGVARGGAGWWQGITHGTGGVREPVEGVLGQSWLGERRSTRQHSGVTVEKSETRRKEVPAKGAVREQSPRKSLRLQAFHVENEVAGQLPEVPGVKGGGPLHVGPQSEGQRMLYLLPTQVLTNFASLPIAAQHRVLRLLNLGFRVFFGSFDSLMTIMHDAVRLGQNVLIPDVIHLGPQKSGSTGMHFCVSFSQMFASGLACADGACATRDRVSYRVTDNPQLKEWHVFNALFTGRQDKPPEKAWRKFLDLGLPTPDVTNLEGDPRSFDLSPAYFKSIHAAVWTYLLAPDPGRLRFVVSLREPVDRLVSEIGMLATVLDERKHNLTTVINSQVATFNACAKAVLYACYNVLEGVQADGGPPLFCSNKGDPPPATLADLHARYLDPPDKLLDLPFVAFQELYVRCPAGHIFEGLYGMHLRLWFQLFHREQFAIVPQSVLNAMNAADTLRYISYATGYYLHPASVALADKFDEVDSRGEEAMFKEVGEDPALSNWEGHLRDCARKGVNGYSTQFDRTPHQDALDKAAQFYEPFNGLIGRHIPDYRF